MLHVLLVLALQTQAPVTPVGTRPVLGPTNARLTLVERPLQVLVQELRLDLRQQAAVRKLLQKNASLEGRTHLLAGGLPPKEEPPAVALPVLPPSINRVLAFHSYGPRPHLRGIFESAILEPLPAATVADIVGQLHKEQSRVFLGSIGDEARTALTHALQRRLATYERIAPKGGGGGKRGGKAGKKKGGKKGGKKKGGGGRRGGGRRGRR